MANVSQVYAEATVKFGSGVGFGFNYKGRDSIKPDPQHPYSRIDSTRQASSVSWGSCSLADWF